MPLFMDLHELDEFSEHTIDELKKGHLMDLAIQAKYNVQYKHYYISPNSKKAFCVMEGPDKESCEAVHKEAHGVIACNIVEVTPNYYNLIMGNEIIDPDGMHVHENGNIDTGSRALLLVNTTASMLNEQFESDELNSHYSSYLNDLNQTLLQHGGREIQCSRRETIYAFTLYRDAVRCGFHLQKRITKFNKHFNHKNIRFETTVVLNVGEPVTRNNEFFGESIIQSRRMSHLGKDGDIIVSSHINSHFRPDYIDEKNDGHVKITGIDDERFINRIMDILENKIHDESFNVIELTEQVGISRPQLYRRIHSLYGISPNHLINELRLKEAVKLLSNKFGNVSEIAFQVGYNNPSYFAKCFKRRFGILPSRYGSLSI